MTTTQIVNSVFAKDYKGSICSWNVGDIVYYPYNDQEYIVKNLKQTNKITMQHGIQIVGEVQYNLLCESIISTHIREFETTEVYQLKTVPHLENWSSSDATDTKTPCYTRWSHILKNKKISFFKKIYNYFHPKLNIGTISLQSLKRKSLNIKIDKTLELDEIEYYPFEDS